MTEPAEKKQCLYCRETKQGSEFRRCRKNRDSLEPRCKSCRDKPRRTVRDRLLARLERQPNGCLVWTGALSSSGYGNIYREGQWLGTHVVAWELENGPVPIGLSVLHHCDNRPCCEPSHLFSGTQRDNMVDMVRKRRSLTGDANPQAVLSALQVVEIRSRHIPGIGGNTAALASEFGIGTRHVGQIASGRRWGVPPA